MTGFGQVRVGLTVPALARVLGKKIDPPKDEDEAACRYASPDDLYGPKLQITPHAYSGPEGKYLTLYSRDKRYGIRFETDGVKVTQYYVGTAEAVQYIEGCQ